MARAQRRHRYRYTTAKKYTKNTKTKLNLTNKQTNIGINAKPGLSLSICRFSQGPRFAVNGEKFC